MLSTSRFTATLIVLVLAQLAVAQSLNLFPRTIAIVFGLAAIVRGSGLLHVFLVPFGFTEIAGLGAALSWIPIVGRHPPPPLLGRLARGGGRWPRRRSRPPRSGPPRARARPEAAQVQVRVSRMTDAPPPRSAP